MKVALITGAARRIGAETARALHEKNINIIIHYLTSKNEANQLCSELNQVRAGSAIALKADLRNLNEIKELVEKGANQWGQLDILINNASNFFPTDVRKSSENEWDELLNTNLKAPFFLIQSAIPWLEKNQGCIINITDTHAKHPMKNHSIYCISKTGLWMLTEAMAKELGPSIRVNAIAPGAVAWPEKENSLDEVVRNKIIDQTALKRPGSRLDIAKAALFLIENADYITGQVITVDGGRFLSL